MRALRCDAPGQLVVIDRDMPVRRPEDVLVRIRRMGVCGTDYHIYHGNQPYFEYPRVLGHELSGEVVEAPVGSDLQAGQIVSIEPYLYCGTCHACRKGRTNCCQRLQVLGVHRDGGACGFVAVPERNVVSADGLSVEHAAMVEFLAIGAHGIRRSGLNATSRVAVVGAGPIGIAATIFAKARGAAVSVLDVNPTRLAFCQDKLGADHVFEVSGDIQGALGCGDRGRLLRRGDRCDGKPDGHAEGLRVRGPRRHLRVPVSRPGLHCVRRSGVPQTGDDAAREPQRDA